MRWIVDEADPEAVRRLSASLGISFLLARLLVLRGITDADSASRFLAPDLAHLHDPFEMLGMENAVRRITQAVERKEKILIYGDYDVDGSLAVVVLRMGLTLAGARVDCYIPHRIRDGYGMREEVIEQARNQDVKVIISVDTGIRAFPVIERAKELGIDCIITDHHLPASDAAAGERIPAATAVLNPKQANCRYPEKNLCGVGVAFKLVQALLERHPEHSRRVSSLLPSFLKLVCIGTIADNVPLLGENRVIARLGLDGLTRPVNHGLKALIQAAGLDGKAIDATDIGFRLAPRLNAAGRMESAQDVIDLFTHRDPVITQELALKLNRLNSERQKAEQQILEEIDERYRREPELFAHQILVLDGSGWHQGVIGIVANRVMDRFGRPTLIISRDGETGHGSGRSFEDFHLLEALTECAEVFDRFGGHACAAGFALRAERIPELRERLNAIASTRLAPETAQRAIRVDAQVSLDELSPALIDDIEKLAPYGYGNPRPVFGAREAWVCGQPKVLKEKHLKLQAGQQGRILDAIAWRKSEWLERLQSPRQHIDIAFQVERNDYQNQARVQLVLLDLIPRSNPS